MPILYSLVSRKKTVLAEYTNSSGNFPTVTRVLLDKIPETDSRMSYVYDKYIFHYIVDQGITFLCMSDENMKRRLTFAYLEDIKKRWRDRFASVEGTALAFSLNDLFSPIMKERIDFYASNPSADTISKVQAQIDTVKDVMIENIDRVLERGERIELLVDKTDRLNQSAYKFEKSSRTLKQSMIWQRVRNYAILLTIIVLLVFFVTAMICGFNFDKC